MWLVLDYDDKFVALVRNYEDAEEIKYNQEYGCTIIEVNF